MPVSELSSELLYSPGTRGTENLSALQNSGVSAFQGLQYTAVNGNAIHT